MKILRSCRARLDLRDRPRVTLFQAIVGGIRQGYWLLDKIALAQQYESAVRAEAFQVWRLDVRGSAATLTCEDGNDCIVRTKAVPFTDFPGPGITLWCANNTILLPSEY